jgi:hypothetical protein
VVKENAATELITDLNKFLKICETGGITSRGVESPAGPRENHLSGPPKIFFDLGIIKIMYHTYIIYIM